MSVESKLKYARKQLYQRKRKPIQKHANQTQARARGAVYRLFECISVALEENKS